MDLTWGEAYVTHDGTAVLGLTRHGVENHPHRMFGPNPDRFLATLRERGYTCTVADERFECKHQQEGREFTGSILDGSLFTLSLWFPGAVPAEPADPQLPDAYAALAQVGPNAAG